MRSIVCAVALLLAFFAGTARAKELPPSKAKALADEAAAALKAKDAKKVTALLAQAVATAHKEKDLAGEEAAAEVLEDAVDALDTDGRAILAGVLVALDAKRHACFVSAHALATELLVREAAVGDGKHLDEAVRVLAAFAATPKCGRAAGALAAWSAGAVAARAGEADAGARLDQAARELSAGGWLRLALHAHLEAALAHLASRNEDAAAKAMSAAAATFTPDSDTIVVREWLLRSVRTRMPEPPAAVEQAIAGLKAAHTGPVSASGAGGRGGAGLAPGQNASALGMAWPRIGTAKPFGWVTRSDAGYEVELKFDPDTKATLKAEPGQKNWDGDGVFLVFADGAVALARIDLVGNRGGPGERSHSSPARAFYYLAPGERYGLSKAGTVTIDS